MIFPPANPDRWSPTKFQNRQNVVQYFPDHPDIIFLWIYFIGGGTWLTGSWVYHPQTRYLDFQLVEEGEMIVEYGGEKYIVPEKSAILIPPGESRISIGSGGVCRKRFLGICGIILQTHLPTLNLDSVKIIPDFKSERFEELYSQLYTCFKEKNPDTIPACCAMTYELLLLLSRSVELGQYPPELQKALSYIKQHLKENLTLHKLSTISGCSAGTLQGLFKKHLGKSPIHFLIASRMKFAEQLLKNTRYTIKEIASCCGYCNQLYFSNVFHEHFGCSPKEYRKKCQTQPLSVSTPAENFL